MLIWLIVAGLCVGISVATQAGVNATLSQVLTTPIQVAFYSFATGALALGMISMLQGGRWFVGDGLDKLPWWAWVGGLLGAFNIAMTVYLAPRLGALLLAVSVVFGQVVASLIFDGQGWLNYDKVTVTPQRLLGVVLMLIGFTLVVNR